MQFSSDGEWHKGLCVFCLFACLLLGKSCRFVKRSRFQYSRSTIELSIRVNKKADKPVKKCPKCSCINIYFPLASLLLKWTIQTLSFTAGLNVTVGQPFCPKLKWLPHKSRMLCRCFKFTFLKPPVWIQLVNNWAYKEGDWEESCVNIIRNKKYVVANTDLHATKAISRLYTVPCQSQLYSL